MMFDDMQEEEEEEEEIIGWIIKPALPVSTHRRSHGCAGDPSGNLPGALGRNPSSRRCRAGSRSRCR